MKIASISFYDLKTQVGGATVSAVAFKKWCDILGFDCDIRCGKENIQIKNYDAVFFSTPIPRTPSFGYATYEELIKLSNIAYKPFALMIHVEDDMNKYGDNLQMFNNENCKALVNIDEKADYFKDWHENRIQWNPCCEPKFTTPRSTPQVTESIIYSARVTPWKNAHLLIAFATQHGLQYQVYGRIDNQDYANKYNIKSIQYDRHELKHFGDLYWGVCGNETNRMLVKRVELAAFEALSHGLMPIVNANAIPDDLKGIFIEVDVDNIDYGKLKEDIIFYRSNKMARWHEMISKMATTSYSYKGARASVIKILNSLGAI